MSNLYRWIFIITLILFVLILIGSALWFFAYEVGQEWPEQATVTALDAPAAIHHLDEDIISINAQSEHDAFVSLGFVHATDRTWSLLLWRQTALGQLAEWFGDNTLQLDMLSRQLGFAVLAKQAYEQLPAEEQEFLQAYTRGVNAAFQQGEVRLSEELSLLHRSPEPWEPWHSLALERLFSQFSSPPPSDRLWDEQDATLTAFFEHDSFLRRWLHLHDFHNSIAWAFRDESRTFLYQRHVFGASAIPFFQDVILTWPGGPVLSGASIPGTPFFPAGKADDRSWAILLSGTIRLVKMADDSASIPVIYERITNDTGVERLIAVRRTRSAIYFDKDTQALPRPLPVDTSQMQQAPGESIISTPDSIFARTPDSSYAIYWEGFEPVSDWTSWHSLLQGEVPTFNLINGNGLLVQSTGEYSVIGSPEVVYRLNQGILIGDSHWAEYSGRSLDSLQRDMSAAPEHWVNSYYSSWAAELAPDLIASADSIPRQSALVSEALTYLRNWDFSYDHASIGASIFDTWVSRYLYHTDTLPSIYVPDTVFFENARRYQMLELAVSDLARRFGNDLSEWRWENVYPDQRFFPVWSADSLIDFPTDELSKTRFAPLQLAAQGHPTSIQWSSSPILSDLPAPAVWEAWISTENWERFIIRRYRFDIGSFLGRYKISSRLPPAIQLDTLGTIQFTTTLNPL